MQKGCLAFFLVFFFLNESNAQIKWTVKKPFEQKNFIQNKGQFFIKDKISPDEILYAATIDGVTYYFTKTGYTVQHLTKQKNTEHEIEQLKEKLGINENEGSKGEDEKEFNYKTISQFHQMQWQGTNPNVQIMADDIVSNYYTYSDVNDKQGKITIKAQAYKKLTYKNIYPFIDVVYEFPADTTGIKYSIYLHPGADVNQIKINYPNNNGVELNQQGNISIKSEFGYITDHQPYTYQLNNKAAIKSNFVLHKNTVGFFVDKTPTNQTIVIDPWTVNPNFPNANRAYDVDYDKLGNVYAYGGDDAMGFCTLNKYSPTGTLIWTYSANTISSYYGDFAIDIHSGSIYIVEGFKPFIGARALKLNSAGVLLATFPGNPYFVEMWRISYSKCSNKAVIAGGGTSSPTYQTCYLDTNLTNLNMVQYESTTNCCHDVNCLALDNYGNCYQVTNKSAQNDGIFDNQLVKLPLPSLMPTTYNVSTNYNLQEAASNYFYSNSVSGCPNGYNGITTSNTNVYTYDSYVLKKWQGSNGAQLAYKRINYPAFGDSSRVYWGGLTSDDCDNVFLGDSNVVRQYNSSLNLVNSFIMPDTIFDVKLGLSNNLYACGANFVSAIQVSLSLCNSTTIQTTLAVQNTNCSNALGSATVTATGGTSPYTITWNTTPVQTGTTAINLPSGTYLASISDNGCPTQTKVDTVVVAFTGFQTQINTSNVLCNGLSTGAATITASNGASPYTYQWQTGQTTSSVSGLAAGTYTVKVADATACANIFSVVITQPPAIAANFSLLKICNSDTATIKVNATGGYTPYTYLWNTNATANQIHGATVGIYSVTITDSAHCTKAATYTYTHPAPIAASFTATTIKCNGDTTNIKVIATGGYSPYTYLWNTTATTNQIYGATAGVYTVTISDSVHCTNVATYTLTQPLPIGASFTSTKIKCMGDTTSIKAIATGGYSPYTYLWNTSATTNQIHGVTAGIYTIAITDSAHCTGVGFDTLTQPTAIVANFSLQKICNSDTATLKVNVTGGISPYTYLWNTNATTNQIHGITVGSYSITITDSAHCTNIATYTFTLPAPLTASIISTNIKCNGDTASVKVNAAGGTSPYTYLWNTNATTNQIHGVSAGVYSVTISDSVQCKQTITYTLTQPAPLTASI
ncbi:MAG TPA: SprB repeat-containing protein, partial [Bacteroidia bacterium]|nr:SprB repeat-containing protein [Bacteroidia bacterium]